MKIFSLARLGVCLLIAGATALGVCPGYAQNNKSSTAGLGLGVGGNSSDWNLFANRPGQNYGNGADKIRTAWRNYAGLNGDVPQRLIYYRPGTGNTEAYVANGDISTGSVQTNTEGIGYALMIAAQMGDGSGSQDDRDAHAVFDAVWRFTRNNLQFWKGKAPGYWYSAWQVRVNTNDGSLSWFNTRGDGSPNEGPAPDGEIWMAAGLLCASGRWGSTAADGSSLDYKGAANNMLQTYLHTEEWTLNDGWMDTQYRFTNMFDLNHRYGGGLGQNTNLVCLVPNIYAAPGSTTSSDQFTDPSYNLAAFFDYFAHYADNDRNTWSNVASSARLLLAKATGQVSNPPNNNASTGLAPNYSAFDGTAIEWTGNGGFGPIHSSDAWRVASIISTDYMWWGGSNNSNFDFHRNFANTYLESHYNRSPGGFYAGSDPKQPYSRLWYPENLKLDGTAIYNGHSEGYASQNTVAAQSASNSAHAWLFVDEMWNASQPGVNVTYGSTYYNGSLYMYGLLQTSGNFRPIPPSGSSGGSTGGGGNTSSNFIGHTIGLKAFNGNYVQAQNGSGSLIANGSSVGSWEKFQVEDAGGGYVWLKSVSAGKYLTAYNDASYVATVATTAQDWEKFIIAPSTGVPGKYTLTAKSNGKYLMLQNGGANPGTDTILNNSTNPYTWESYEIFDQGSVFDPSNLTAQ